MKKPSAYQMEHPYNAGMREWGKVRLNPRVEGYGGVDQPVVPSKPLKRPNTVLMPNRKRFRKLPIKPHIT